MQEAVETEVAEVAEVAEESIPEAVMGKAEVLPVKAWIRGAEYNECPVCSARMQGWAMRQNFHYCPMCGERLA